MIDQTKPLTITQQIDADEGLKSKRKLLTIASLILLALSFTSAKVVEANTFILKLSFDNSNGIATLLVLAIIFLLIRYYNYAYQYHQKLYKVWTGRLLDDPFLLVRCDHSDMYSGLIKELKPKGFDLEADKYNHVISSFCYKYGAFFVGRKIEYRWDYSDHGRQENFETVSIGLKDYFKVIRLEMRYRAQAFFKHRESLDILAPYFLGAIAILSYVCNDWLIALF